MIVSKFFLMTSVGGLVAAWPEPTPAASLEDRAIDCAKVTGALAVLKNLGPPATTFCRSYLNVPGTKITTTTTTPATVTSATSTTTVVVTSATCQPPAARRINLIYDSRDSSIDYLGDVEKRTDVLAPLAAFTAAKISEGCSCLNLQPTLTKVVTLTATAPTVNVVATSTKCANYGPPVQPPACQPDYATCATSGECCGGICSNGYCF